MRSGSSTAQPWEAADDPALAYAYLKQLWYDRKRARFRRAHQISELLILLSTSSTVVIAALHAPALATASAAAASVVLTGYRQVFQPSEARVDYTVTALELEHLIARYKLVPEAERDAAGRQELLDQVIEITSTEMRSWAERTRTVRNPAAGTPKSGSGPSSGPGSSG